MVSTELAPSLLIFRKKNSVLKAPITPPLLLKTLSFQNATQGLVIVLLSGRLSFGLDMIIYIQTIYSCSKKFPEFFIRTVWCTMSS
jgi:hypothetical protein